MIVRAIATTGDVLPVMSRDSNRGIDGDTEFPLTIGRTYPVYAVTVFLGIAWYYIFNDDRLDWPIHEPAPLFEVVDGTVPASWRLGYFNFGRENQFPILSFPEWAEDHAFYERLVDGDVAAVQVFNERRHEIE